MENVIRINDAVNSFAWGTFGLALRLATAIILLGGFRRLSAVSEKLVPYMSIAYIAGCLLVLLIVFGAVMESNLAWDISDTFNGLMMIPNLIGVIAQIPVIIRLTGNYTDRRIRGKDIEPMLSFDPDIQRDAQKAVKKGAD